MTSSYPIFVSVSANVSIIFVVHKFVVHKLVNHLFFEWIFIDQFCSLNKANDDQFKKASKQPVNKMLSLRLTIWNMGLGIRFLCGLLGDGIDWISRKSCCYVGLVVYPMKAFSVVRFLRTTGFPPSLIFFLNHSNIFLDFHCPSRQPLHLLWRNTTLQFHYHRVRTFFSSETFIAFCFTIV